MRTKRDTRGRMREVTISRTANYPRMAPMHVSWCASEVSGNRKKSKLCCISISQWYSPCPNVESGHAGNISCVIGCAYCSDEFDKVPNAFEPERRLPITEPTHSAR